MMLTPNLYVENDARFPEQVAVAATFAPSFDTTDPELNMVFVEDEVPAKLSVDGSQFHFVFIIDRSGSM